MEALRILYTDIKQLVSQSEPRLQQMGQVRPLEPFKEDYPLLVCTNGDILLIYLSVLLQILPIQADEAETI